MAMATELPRRGKGRHWAQPGLPEPPRHRHEAKSMRPPVDRLGHALEEWLSELTLGNTIDAD